jgi:hypothetical protein
MNELIARLRRDAELEESENGDAAPAGGPNVDDALIMEFYATHEGAWFDAALDALAEHGWQGLGADSAGQPAVSSRQPRQRSVVEALAAPATTARSALTTILDISVDAAELLLERPASVLLTYAPPRVAALAVACGQTRGRIFAAVADSVRAGDPYVYAYRPGPPAAEPARLASDSTSTAQELLAWGRELFELRPAADHTSR